MVWCILYPSHTTLSLSDFISGEFETDERAILRVVHASDGCTTFSTSRVNIRPSPDVVESYVLSKFSPPWTSTEVGMAEGKYVITILLPLGSARHIGVFSFWHPGNGRGPLGLL